MNQFEIAAEHKPTCDICGGSMAATYGGGWENDRLICGDRRPCWEMKTVREEIAKTDKKRKDHNGRAPLPFVL